VGGAVSLLGALLCIIIGIIFMTTDIGIFTELIDNMYMDRALHPA